MCIWITHLFQTSQGSKSNNDQVDDSCEIIEIPDSPMRPSSNIIQQRTPQNRNRKALL